MSAIAHLEGLLQAGDGGGGPPYVTVSGQDSLGSSAWCTDSVLDRLHYADGVWRGLHNAEMHDPFTDDALCPAVASTGAGLHKVTGKTVMWSRFGRVQVAFLPWKRYHAAAMASVRSTAGFKPSKFLRCSPPLPSLQKRSMNFLPLHQSSSGSNLTKMPSLQHDGSDWAFRMVIEDSEYACYGFDPGTAGAAQL